MAKLCYRTAIKTHEMWLIVLFVFSNWKRWLFPGSICTLQMYRYWTETSICSKSTAITSSWLLPLSWLETSLVMQCMPVVLDLSKILLQVTVCAFIE